MAKERESRQKKSIHQSNDSDKTTILYYFLKNKYTFFLKKGRGYIDWLKNHYQQQHNNKDIFDDDREMTFFIITGKKKITVWQREAFF